MWRYYLSRNYYVWLVSGFILLPVFIVLAFINYFCYAAKQLFSDIYYELKPVNFSRKNWEAVNKTQERKFKQKKP